MEFDQDVPCADCDDWKQRLEDNDYHVLDCKPTSNGFCKIRYRHKVAATTPEATAAPAVPAATAPPAATAAPAAKSPEAAAPAPAPAIAATPLMANAMAMSSSVITKVQEQTAKAIVNIFETSQVLGDYSAVAVLPNDKGRLTYGRSQTTLGSGNLFLMLDRYCDNGGARYAQKLRKWLPRLQAKEASLDRDERLKNLLRACADDPVMRDVQDRFFDQFYWMPALKAAQKLGVRLPLSICIVYDSHVHGSWEALKAKTDAQGAFSQATEQDWVRRYVEKRRAWLAGHTNPALHPTVYRMDAFTRLMDQGYWGLSLPLLVRSQEISLASLVAQPPNCYDGPEPGSRVLAIQSGLLRGLDVRLLQLALSDIGGNILADGVYGSTSARHVREYQAQQGQPPTGVADPQLIAVVLQQASGVA
jgi:chitosanase